jgi:hypothetical protein
MKPNEYTCTVSVMDSDSYILEAATSTRYNFVSFTLCRNYTSTFESAIIELMKYAKINERANVWHEKHFLPAIEE